MLEFRKSFEVIFVNDGSTDSSCKVLAGICEGNQDVTVIDLIKNYGKAAALEQGFKTARGEYIVTIDSDLQYDPKDIPVLIRALEKGADVASVKRINRLDPMSTIAFSKVYNAKCSTIIQRFPMLYRGGSGCSKCANASSFLVVCCAC